MAKLASTHSWRLLAVYSPPSVPRPKATTERVGGIRRVAQARLEEVQEVLRTGGERDPVGLEHDALGADGVVGEPLVAPPASEGWCGTPPLSVSLGVASAAGGEEAARRFWGAIIDCLDCLDLDPPTPVRNASVINIFTFRSSLFETKGRTCKRGTVQLARTRDTPRAKQSYTENFHRTSHRAHRHFPEVKVSLT